MNKLIGIIVASVAVIILIYSFSGGETEEQYIERIKEEREEKDRFMRSSKESPFRESDIKFKPLQYFPPDPAYKVSANFIPGDKKVMMIPTNDGEEVRYLRYGYAEFQLHDKLNRLVILELADGSESEGHLFIPFGDETSARETYGAGRYLDVEHDNKRRIILDFNQAYNPYCAYVETYSCPMPPRENLLEISVKAGEKTFK